ncbi:MAG: signal peptide peptidase SppA [Candidatus Dojkabacteria bacterium]
MSKKVVLAIVVVVTLLAILAFCCFLAFSMYAVLEEGYVSGVETTTLFTGDASQKIAVIDIDEVITSTEVSDIWGNTGPDMATSVISLIERARRDDSVKAILLRVNTPGGEVYATRRIYNKIQDFRDEGKTLVVLMEDVAASGGYYVSAPADHIVASEMTLTGSIGVIFSQLDITGLYEKLGVQEIKISNTDGNLKVLEDLDDRESKGYKLLQTVADDYYDNFISVVTDGRGLTAEEVIPLADGRVYSGKQAMDNGLVDSLGEQEQAIEKIMEIAGLDDPAIIRYDAQENSFNTLSLKLANLLNPVAALTGHDGSGALLKAMYILNY